MIVHLYTDGGVIRANPSPIGGTWAYRILLNGLVQREHAFAMRPDELGLTTVSNNVTELLAVLYGLRALANGRTVHVWSDSGVTLTRVFRNGQRAGVPTWMSAILDEQQARFSDGRLTLDGYTLLGGHPTAAELTDGKRRDGKPVSAHNVWCDQACTAAGLQLLKGWHPCPNPQPASN